MIEYDFDDTSINQFTQPIIIPSINTEVFTSRVTSNSDPTSIFLDIEQMLIRQKYKEKKKIKAIKDQQYNIGSQIEKKLAEKQKKLRELSQIQKRKIEEQCTFQPKITTKNRQKRTLNQFLSQQNQFTKKVEQKKNHLKNNLEQLKQKETFQPKINKRSEKRRIKDETIFQRLYSLKDKQNNINFVHEMQNIAIHPKVQQKSKNLKKHVPIEQILYEDALKRKSKIKMISQIKSNEFETESRRNFMNEKYVAQKLIKQYFSALQKLRIDPDSNQIVDEVIFTQILKLMHFVQQTTNTEIIHQAYELIEEKESNVKNICVFLLAIIGIFNISPVDFQKDQHITEKQLILSEQEGRQIQKHFEIFKRNKISKEDKKQIQQITPIHTFQPITNKQYDSIAQRDSNMIIKQVNKLIQTHTKLNLHLSQDDCIRPTDLLTLNNQLKELKIKQKNEKQLINESTFHPATLNHSLNEITAKSKLSRPSQDINKKKCEQFYNKQKNFGSKKEEMKLNRHEIDKNLREFTSTPHLNQHKIVEDKPNFLTKQVEKSIHRMKKERQQHEEKAKQMESGEFINSKQIKADDKRNMQMVSKPQKNPILVLDVNLGETTDEIIIREGDENRLDQIAFEFALKHKLEQQNIRQLRQLLKQQLCSVLSKIDEDEQNEHQQ